MADYIPYARTNYFKVKPDKLVDFQEVAGLVGGDVHNGRDGSVCLIFETQYNSQIDLTRLDKETCLRLFGINQDAENSGIDLEEYTVFLEGWIADYLEDGEVAIYREIGFEKMRYLVGYTIAVHSSGEVVEISLDDIYDEAKKVFGLEEVSRCEY